MKFFVPVVLAVSLLAGLACAGQNPCHSDKAAQGKGVTCGKVVLPRGLCKACKLKPFLPNGNFENCKSIYDLDNNKCRKQLKQYARLNKKCDPVRAKQVKDFDKNANKEGLDYFVYSVCEECCDCIPRGAKIEEYNRRLAIGTLFKPNRGNCPAHAWYDICKIWPKVKYVSLPGWKKPKDLPEICPILTSWLNSPASSQWLLQSRVDIAESIKGFLGRFLIAAKCRNKKLWESCHKLESAQNRL